MCLQILLISLIERVAIQLSNDDDLPIDVY